MIEKKESYSTLVENTKLKKLFFVLFSALSLSLLYIYQYYIWPFLFAFILYIALRPLYDLITKYVKKRFLSSVIIISILFLLVLVPIFMILIALADQAYELYLYLQQRYYAGILMDFIHESEIISSIFSYIDIKEEDILQQSVDFLRNTSLKIFTNLTAILTFSINLIINIVFMLLILFFLFKDGSRIEESIYRILPFPDDIEKVILDRLKEVIKILLAGNILIMISQGIVVGLAFFIFGVRMPLLWGTITAILSLIPIIGTTLIWVPVVIYFIYTGAYFSAIFIGIWCLLGYLLLENVLKPLIFGERLNFHPLIFFFLLLGSIQAFNLPGIIIGPILLALFYSFWEIYKLLGEYSSNNSARS